MPSVYPGALDAFPTGRITGDVIPAADHNDVADAANRIEAELGTDPAASFATVAARLNARLTCRKTADQTFSATTTVAAVSDMLLPLTAGMDHWFKFFGVYNSASTTNGIRLALALSTGTASLIAARASMWGRVAVTAGTQAVAAYEAFISAIGTAVASDGVAATGTPYPFVVEGIVNPSANANLILQAANEVSTSSGNVIRKGSFGEVYIN